MNENSTPIQTIQPVDTSPVSGGESKKSSLPLYIFLIVGVFLLFLGAGYFFSKPSVQPIAEQFALKPTLTPMALSFTSPKDQVFAVSGEILVSGTTLPNTTVVVYSEIDDVSLDSDSEGKFETTIKVDEAGGFVNVVAFSEDGQEKSETLNIGENKEVSFLRVPDVLAKTVENPGKLKKEEKSASTRIVEFLQSKPEKIKDTKVGTVVLKKLTTGKDPKVKKMKVTSVPTTSTMKRHAVSGIITSIAGDVITIAHQIQRDRTYSIFANTSTVFSIKGVENGTISSLTVGMRIVAVGELVEQGILAKRIHVIPGKAIGVFKKQPSVTTTLSPTATPSLTTVVSPTVTPVATLTPTITLEPSIPPEQ